MPTLSDGFLRVDGPEHELENADVVVLPVPFERTTSYGKGTSEGPAALLRASHYVEEWDEELERDHSGCGICTLPTFLPEEHDLETALGELEEEVRTHFEAGRFPLVLGGEHSLTSASVRAAESVHGRIGVVQFDAHADLRDTYEGTPWSHACVMRRIVERGTPTLAVGIRALSEPEATLIRERNLPTLWGRQLESDAEDRFRDEVRRLPDKVYVTFDVDYFDPSLMSATGTPEPGGGTWYPTLRMLRHLFENREVVGMDIVELAPRAGLHACDFLAAKLAYRCLGYRTLRA